MATYSSILAQSILWTEEPSRLHTVHGIAESDATEATEHACTEGLQMIFRVISFELSCRS